MPLPVSEAAPPYRLVFAPDRDDVASFLLMPREAPMRRKWLFIGIVFACGMAGPLMLDLLGVPDDVQDNGWFRLLAGAGVALAGWLLYTLVTSIRMTRRLRRIPALLPEQTVVVDAAGITLETDGRTQSHRWADIGQVTNRTQRLYICPDPTTAIIVPCRAFSDPAAFDAFAAWVERMADDAGENPATLQN